MTKTNQADTTAIAVINVNIANIKNDVTDIKQYIKDLNAIFATRETVADLARQNNEKLEQVAKDTKNDLQTLQVQMREQRKSSQLWKFLTPTFSATAAVILEYLFLFYLMHK